MRHIALLAVIAGLLGGLVVGQVRPDYDERYAEEVDWQENRQAMRHCQSCNPDECETPTGCVAGIVKDPCQCCDVCGKAEFELCDHPQVRQRSSTLCTLFTSLHFVIRFLHTFESIDDLKWEYTTVGY